MNPLYKNGKYLPDIEVTDEQKDHLRRYITAQILEQIGYDYDLSSVKDYADAGRFLSVFGTVRITRRDITMEDIMRKKMS